MSITSKAAALPLVLLALGAGPGVAGAQTAKPVVADPDPFAYVTPADRAKMRAQEPLKQAADIISEAAEQDAKGNGSSGFTSVELGDGAVVVHWKGALPKAVKDAVERARGKARVDVQPADHSGAQLKAAARRLQDDLQKHTDKAFAISVPTDGSGIDVQTEGDVARVKPDAANAGVPVHVARGEVAREHSRLSDTPPYWGGARIINPETNSSCTSGFAVTDGWTRYILTAGHCGRPGGRILNGDRSREIGRVSAEDVGFDIMLIPASVDGRMYDGGVGVNEFSKRVSGFAPAYPGEWLCVSGSYTGAVCGVQATSNFWYSYCTTDMYGRSECRWDLVEAYQRGGQRAVQHGDSGGPVFALSGNYDVLATGTITGGNSSGTQVLFQDFKTARERFNIVPV
jgi:hypothetical protein